MEINKKIISVLEEHNINVANGICYLISLYFRCDPSYIPDDFKVKVNLTQLFSFNNKRIKWKYPLFLNKNENNEDSFDWIKTEYVPLFKQVNSDRGGKVRESILRMKKLFEDNPDINKNIVLKATKLYLSSTDFRYIRLPHYFISKGVGTEKISDLLDWIDKCKEENKSTIIKLQF